jgi:DNA-binding NarL/FixJ family response regulator
MRLDFGGIGFTPLEYAVVHLVTAGESNPVIANKLRTTRGVIKNYIHAIYDKTGHSNRVELALWVIRHENIRAKRSRFS